MEITPEILDQMIESMRRLPPMPKKLIWVRPGSEEERRLMAISEYINKRLRWPL